MQHICLSWAPHGLPILKHIMMLIHQIPCLNLFTTTKWRVKTHIPLTSHGAFSSSCQVCWHMWCCQKPSHAKGLAFFWNTLHEVCHIVDTFNHALIDEVHHCDCCLCQIDILYVLLQHGACHLKNNVINLLYTTKMLCIDKRIRNKFSSNRSWTHLKGVLEHHWTVSIES